MTLRDFAGSSQAPGSDRLNLTDLPEISDLLLRHQAVSLRVEGWSMYPTLCKGDRLTVEPVSAAQLRSGDLALFVHRFADGPRLICHRLIRTMVDPQRTSLVTKGDAVAACDPPVQAGQVLGRVAAISRPWWRAWPGFPSLAMRLDRWMSRLLQSMAQLLEQLQGLCAYRRLMRSVLLSRFFRYFVGVPDGGWWYRYQPVQRGGASTLTGHRRLRLLAKLGRSHAGAVQLRAVHGGYAVEALSVRLRYRGLGVASQLLRLAAMVISIGDTTTLRIAVERDNRAACRLLRKMGFREASSASDESMILVREIQATTKYLFA